MRRKRKSNPIEPLLAPYAMKIRDSRGRVYKQDEHAYRTIYQRDRDRVVHSTAFRRLEYKTQVFVIHEGDYYRTRLTHTIEVAQIARTIACALGLNADLTEAIALAHDLGHTPFGHAGEDALNELMKNYGGFNHNRQSLRVVDQLEERYPDFPGLNLTWEVREGIAKHSSNFDEPVDIEELMPQELPTLEAQIVDIADEIAYDNHDLDDGLTSGLLKDSDLEKLGIWREVNRGVNKRYSKIDRKKKGYLIIRQLINAQVTDLIGETRKNLKSMRIRSYMDVKTAERKIAAFSLQMQQLREPLRGFLKEKMYNHYRVIRMSNKAKKLISDIFTYYIQKPKALTAEDHERLLKYGKERAICDYIASMTDRYAQDEYKKLFDPHERV